MNKNETFIKKAVDIHGDKYDYSEVNYINNKFEVKIICKIHGVFKQKPVNHIYFKCGCPICAGNKKTDVNSFIKKCNDLYQNKYDYSKIDYKNMNTKIIIICPIHGEFKQTPANHLKHECRKCSFDKERKNFNEILIKFKKIHGDIYDYSKSQYNGMNKKISIICKKHGVFEQTPSNHMKKKGCPRCSPNSKKSYDEILNKLNRLHENKYFYEHDMPKTSNKIKIMCKKHGEFYQTLNNHLDGHGCPFCNDSNQEKKINDFLLSNNIKVVRQKKFIDCVDKKNLPFDFFLPELNVCIEYDGEHHFKEIEKWGGKNSLSIIQYHDKIKNEYCLKNKISLYRISYMDNIIDRLKEIMNENNLNRI